MKWTSCGKHRGHVVYFLLWILVGPWFFGPNIWVAGHFRLHQLLHQEKRQLDSFFSTLWQIQLEQEENFYGHSFGSSTWKFEKLCTGPSLAKTFHALFDKYKFTCIFVFALKGISEGRIHLIFRITLLLPFDIFSCKLGIFFYFLQLGGF